MPAGNTTLTWAFATGECGSENWGGISYTLEASNVQAFVNAGKKYIIGHEPERNGASYFRVQGPKVFIEFSPQRPGGDLTQHVHTIYRDPSNPYGQEFVARLAKTKQRA